MTKKRNPDLKAKQLFSKQNLSEKQSFYRDLQRKPSQHMNQQQIKTRRIIQIKELKRQKRITAKRAMEENRHNQLDPLKRRNIKRWRKALKSGHLSLHQKIQPDVVRPKVYQSKRKTRHQINKQERKAQPNPIKRHINKMVDRGIARRERERRKFLSLRPKPKRNIAPEPQGPTM